MATDGTATAGFTLVGGANGTADPGASATRRGAAHEPERAARAERTERADPLDRESELEERIWQERLKKESNTAFAFLRANAYLNVIIRGCLYATGLVLLATLAWYLNSHADAMARELLGTRNAPTQDYWRTLGSVLVPVAALLGFAFLCVALALYAQSRGIHDFERAMDGIGRLRRDAVGVPRGQAIANVLEEAILAQKRAFSLQLWLGRALFLVSSLLLVAFVGYSMAMRSIDSLSVVLGAGSIGAAVITGFLHPGEKVGRCLADLTQLQLATVIAVRQVNLVEELAFATLKLAEDPKAPSADRHAAAEAAASMVTTANDQLSQIRSSALEQIQQMAEPGDGGSVARRPATATPSSR